LLAVLVAFFIYRVYDVSIGSGKKKTKNFFFFKEIRKEEPYLARMTSIYTIS
jgi:hypothetical protein